MEFLQIAGIGCGGPRRRPTNIAGIAFHLSSCALLFDHVDVCRHGLRSAFGTLTSLTFLTAFLLAVLALKFSEIGAAHVSVVDAVGDQIQEPRKIFSVIEHCNCLLECHRKSVPAHRGQVEDHDLAVETFFIGGVDSEKITT